MLNAERYKNEILEKSNVVFDFSMQLIETSSLQ